MPPTGGRAGCIYVYVVSSFLFLAIVAGGAFLVLYVFLPGSATTAWFPFAGIALVATPWLFWFAACLYRGVSLRKPARGGGADTAPAAPALSATVAEDAVVDSPGGGRRVRFGPVTVMGSSTDFSAGSGGGGSRSPEKVEVGPAEEGDGG